MLDQFYSMRPALSATQLSIQSAYYQARREADADGRIKLTTLKEFAAPLLYEVDLAVLVMQRLDDFYLGLIAEKRKRDLENK